MVICLYVIYVPPHTYPFLLDRVNFFYFRIATVVHHLPCNTDGSGTCADAKWENAVSKKLFLPHVGDSVCIPTIRDQYLFKARLQGKKTKIHLSW
jgi:hypothetical protein